MVGDEGPSEQIIYRNDPLGAPDIGFIKTATFLNQRRFSRKSISNLIKHYHYHGGFQIHFDMKYLLILFRILRIVDAGVPRKAWHNT